MTDIPPMVPSAEERLAQHYMKRGAEGPYPTYAELSRNRKGDFTIRSLDAIGEAFRDGVLAERARTDEAGKLIQEAAALLPGRDEEIRKKERARLLAALREPHLSWRSGKACADWLEKHNDQT